MKVAANNGVCVSTLMQLEILNAMRLPFFVVITQTGTPFSNQIIHPIHVLAFTCTLKLLLLLFFFLNLN